MWRLVKEGLRFYGSTLLISWCVGAGIFLLVVALLAILEPLRSTPALARLATQAPIAILVASLIAGFIVTGSERGEARVRLQMMLPLRLREIALARVLLPAAVILEGTVVAYALAVATLIVPGSSSLADRHLETGFVAALMLFWLQAALFVREIIEMVKAGRRAIATAYGVILAIAFAGTTGLKIVAPSGRAELTAVILAIDVVIMAFTVLAFERRLNFTK